jgi:transcriptional/translational regulatory protein YebC/TACO1
MNPANWVELDQEQAATIDKLIDHFEDLDDVQTVYTNASFPDTDA